MHCCFEISEFGSGTWQTKLLAFKEEILLLDFLGGMPLEEIPEKGVRQHIVWPPDDAIREVNAAFSPTRDAALEAARMAIKTPNSDIHRYGPFHPSTPIYIAEVVEGKRCMRMWTFLEMGATLRRPFCDFGEPVDSDPLSERAQLVLVAMYEFQAFNLDDKRSIDEIAKAALDQNATANTLRTVMAELKARQLIKSKEGRGGGCWLTENGRIRAANLAISIR